MTEILQQKTRLDQYYDFLERKIVLAKKTGFVVEDSELHPSNFHHQREVIKWAAKKGRAGIFLRYGLGKTQVQIELARLAVEKFGGKALIVCPLGVRHMFTEIDGPRLGVEFNYVRSDEEIEASDTPFLVTNTERIRNGNIDPRKHNIVMVSLDEGDYLRNLASETYQEFDQVLTHIPYRFVCTATPDPNSYRELIYIAHWLGIMDYGLALTQFFKRNPQKAGDLTLMDSQAEKYWLWVSSWALFLYHPKDLCKCGCHHFEGVDCQECVCGQYTQPELNVHWVKVDVDHTRAFDQMDNQGQRRMFLDASVGLSEASAEKRATIPDRVEMMLEIMAGNPDRHWLLWHHLEDERKAIQKVVPEAKSVYGKQDLEEREALILGFSRGDFPILSTKPEIAGAGCNFQYFCYSNIFVGINYKYRDFIQALHRTHRFQQKRPVDVWILYAESEAEIATALKDKWQRDNDQSERMREIIKEYGLDQTRLEDGLKRSIGVERQEVRGQRFTAVLNDCVAEWLTLPDNHFGMICTSIPFSKHYEYVPSYNDFGHNADDDLFFEQMDFLIPELYRTLKPGRIAAIHVKDLVNYGHASASGFMEINPFSGRTLFAFLKHGFMYEGEIIIPTDVVRENNATYRLSYTEMCKDGSKMGVGLPEKVLLFRKPPTSTDTARADEPVVHSKKSYPLARWQLDAHGVWATDGNRLLTPVELYSYEAHVARLKHLEDKGNLPKKYLVEPPPNDNPYWVWDDINAFNCLNSEQVRRGLEKHTCPMPLDINRRLIERFTSDPKLTKKPDIVADPFAGLLSALYVAIELGREAFGTELNELSFRDGVRHCQNMEAKILSPTLFDLLEQEEVAPVNGRVLEAAA